MSFSSSSDSGAAEQSRSTPELLASELLDAPRLTKIELLLNLSAPELAAVCRSNRRLALTLCGIGNAQEYRVARTGPLSWGLYAQPDDRLPVEVVADTELIPELWLGFLKRDYGVSPSANECSAYTSWERENVAASMRRYLDGYDVDQLMRLRRLRGLYMQLFNLSLAEKAQTVSVRGVLLRSKEVYLLSPEANGSERLTLIDRTLLLFMEYCVRHFSNGLVFAVMPPEYNTARDVENTIVFAIVDLIALCSLAEPAVLRFILGEANPFQKLFALFNRAVLATLPGSSSFLPIGKGPGLYEMTIDTGTSETTVVYRPPVDPAERAFAVVSTYEDLQTQVQRNELESISAEIAQEVAPYARVVVEYPQTGDLSYVIARRSSAEPGPIREIYPVPGHYPSLRRLQWVVPVLKNEAATAPSDRFDAEYVAVLGPSGQIGPKTIRVFVLYLERFSPTARPALLYEIGVAADVASVEARLVGPSALYIGAQSQNLHLVFDWRTGEAFYLPSAVGQLRYFTSVPWLRPHTVFAARLRSDRPLFRVDARILEPVLSKI